VVAPRKSRGHDPLTFGMTFPFSTHNYHLRFWMAAGGVDPDEDVRLVVLPPPYMVESLANKHVDAFCVGAPWNSGRGRSRHRLHPAFRVGDPAARLPRRCWRFRSRWAREHPDMLARWCARTRAPPTSSRSRQPRRGRGDPRAPNRIGVAPR
jgi:NitT/TauT family transport system ATP-binding protein